MMNETETQTRLRRAKEAMEYTKQQENKARIALAEAERRWLMAKERYEELFLKFQREEVARIKKDNLCSKSY